MDCAEIRSGFVSGRVPEGPAVDEHLKWCPHCRELFAKGARLGRSLAASVLPAVDAGDLFAQVDGDLARDQGLRARLRALPTSLRATALVLVGLSLPALQLLVRPRPDLGEYSPGVFWSLAALLVALLSYGAVVLLRGVSSPLHVASRDRFLGIGLVATPVAVALLSPTGSSSTESEWGHPALCFSYGALLVVPFLALLWLFERRERVPLAVVMSAGALAGIAANLLLHAHCPSSHLGHLLLGHASIGLAWSLALALVSRSSTRAV